MGCFCRHVMVPPVPAFDAALALELRAPSIVAALSASLSARWLPPAIPWAPDLAWLELRLPTVAMSAQATAAMMALVNARAAIMLAFNLDPLVPAHQVQLARIVATLNLRLALLAPLAADWRPWSALALLNGQLDTIRLALSAGLFESAHLQLNVALAASAISPSLPSWRALLAQLMALLPVIAIVEMLKLDLSDPAAALSTLAVTIRGLRLVGLPQLALPHLVMQLIARNDAIARLQASLGPLPFPELRIQVALKLQAVLAMVAQVAPGLSVSATTGVLLGMPNLLPNPGLVINAATIAGASRLSASFMAGLNWNVAVGLELPLLTIGAPVASLVSGLVGVGVTADVSAGLGLGPVLLSPCDVLCDAGKALAAAL